jgi:hypothetical protein
MQMEDWNRCQVGQFTVRDLQGVSRRRELFCGKVMAGEQQNARRSLLAKKFVVQNRRCQSHRFCFCLAASFPGADDPSLAENAAVFLAGDFFRHLENHFDQRVVWQVLWTLEEHTRLAQVFDDAFIPAAQILDPITHGDLQLQAPGSRDPARLLGVAATAAGHGGGFVRSAVHLISTPHGLPVVLVLDGAKQANLVVVAVGGPPGPGKFMGAAAKHEDVQ